MSSPLRIWLLLHVCRSPSPPASHYCTSYRVPAIGCPIVAAAPPRCMHQAACRQAAQRIAACVLMHRASLDCALHCFHHAHARVHPHVLCQATALTSPFHLQTLLCTLFEAAAPLSLGRKQAASRQQRQSNHSRTSSPAAMAEHACARPAASERLDRANCPNFLAAPPIEILTYCPLPPPP
jgi:hypothetical protein